MCEREKFILFYKTSFDFRLCSCVLEIVCVYVRERERMCVCVRERERVCVCVRERERVCVCVCV